jgi:hypothetical protein
MGSLVSLAPDMTSDATFRAICAAISGQLDSYLPKTSDTGQVNTATVTKAGSANTAAGYEIRRSNDGLTNYYIKVEYGCGGSTSWFSMWLTVGTGTNGSGTLTGQVGSRVQINMTGQTSTASNWAFAGGTSWFAMASCYDGATAGTGIVWSVERGRNKDTGANEAVEIVWATAASGASNYNHGVVPYSGTIANWTTVWPCAAFPGSTMSVDGNVGLLPYIPHRGGARCPALGLCLYVNGDIAKGTVTSSVTRFGGTACTYLALGSSPVGVVSNQFSTSLYAAMRYS